MHRFCIKVFFKFFFVGDRTVQCGRRNDVLKLWLMWKGRGDKGMAAKVEKAFENARLVDIILFFLKYRVKLRLSMQ